MEHPPLASVIINNYNYARFLKEAIDSALNQTYQNTEVIIVDDGSTDGSREIIASYGNRIIPVLKENGGQTSALNASFSVSRGELIFFVDADDALLPTAVDRAMEVCLEAGIAKVHWPLLEIDASSHETGRVLCDDLAQGDLREILLRDGPGSIDFFPPMTGNAFARWFLDEVLPIPQVEKRFNLPGAGANGTDMILSILAPLFGRIGGLSDPQACYRVHGQNAYASRTFDDRLRHDLIIFNHISNIVAQQCSNMGINLNSESWKSKSWVHRLYRAANDIAAIVPQGDGFILVDEEQWNAGRLLSGRRRFHFLERDGEYWGHPPDDATAIREIERLREARANYIVFAWPAFWWLNHYTEFERYLNSEFRCVLQNNDVVMFDLRRPDTVGASAQRCEARTQS